MPSVLRMIGGSMYRSARQRLWDQTPDVVPQVSMTLEWDDVHCARSWRQRHADFEDLGEIGAFEREFASWNGSRHAVSFSAGRVALSACLASLEIEDGAEIVIPGYTCIAVPNAVRFARMIPVYCDIELETYGMDVQALERNLTSRTRCIVMHHLYGLVSRDYLRILEVASSLRIPVVEDCAHATGAELHGSKVGNRGVVAIYSTEQSKVLNSIRGGLATTNDDEVAGRLRAFQENLPFPSRCEVGRLLDNVTLHYYLARGRRSHFSRELARRSLGSAMIPSITPEEERGYQPAAYAQRMSAPVAALARNQLRKVDSFNERRRETASQWDGWCRSRQIPTPVVVGGSRPVFLRYPILISEESKRNPAWAASQLGVELGLWFQTHTHPVRTDIGQGCPNADRAVRECVNFPCLLA